VLIRNRNRNRNNNNNNKSTIFISKQTLIFFFSSLKKFFLYKTVTCWFFVPHYSHIFSLTSVGPTLTSISFFSRTYPLDPHSIDPFASPHPFSLSQTSYKITNVHTTLTVHTLFFTLTKHIHSNSHYYTHHVPTLLPHHTILAPRTPLTKTRAPHT